MFRSIWRNLRFTIYDLRFARDRVYGGILRLMPTAPVNVHDLLKGHVTLQLESIDRLYLNGYVPHLQHGAGLVGFLSQHRGYPIASPALLGQITGQFVAQVKAFAQREGIPLFPFERHESKDQCAHHWRAQRPVRDAVVFIGVAQEKANAFGARRLLGAEAATEPRGSQVALASKRKSFIKPASWKGEAAEDPCTQSLAPDPANRLLPRLLCKKSEDVPYK